MSSLQYSELDRDKTEIRVLDLQPAKDPDSPIHCSMRNVSLDNPEPPQYDALSYVWGETSPSFDIYVNGVVFAVGKNLRDALTALRLRKKPRVVWADAICINQAGSTNSEEKNYLVPLMGRIYSEASNTVIWLGLSNENVDLMVSWLKPSQSPAWLKVNTKAAFSEKARRERDIMTIKAVAGYFDLLMRQYWYRMWTFQEFLLPPSEPVCYCGTNEFTMTSVNEIESRRDAALNEVRARVKVQLTGKDDEALDKDTDLREYVEAVHYNIRPLGQKTADALAGASVFKIRDVYHSGKKDTLAYFLGMTGERNCYMGHDKFFAIYGILPILQTVARVDYNKPLRQLTLEMTEHMVSIEHNKNMYACFPLREGHLDNDSEYPSWIPEYTRGSQETDGHNMYDTGEGLAEELRDDNLHGCEAASVENSTILRAHGVLAGTVTHTVQFGTTMAGIVATLDDLLAMDNSYQEEAMAGATLRRQSDIPKRVAHAGVSNMLSLLRGDLNMVDEIKEIHGVFESGETPIFRGKWHTLDTHNKLLYLSGKAVFFTDTGLFGIGSSLVKPGHTVVILKNERLPIVLARQEADVDMGKESFLMVGTAYLDGAMENEWKDTQLVAELSQQSRKEFIIC